MNTKEKITFNEFENADFSSLLEMSVKLWTDFDERKLEELLRHSSESKKNKIILAKNLAKKAVGFSIFSIRTDYVEGADISPTGYLEGIFVEQDNRNMGIAKEFIRLGEVWCKENGCTQLGSDTWLTAKESREFHKKVGFWEEEEVVHFLKNIK
jgi:aminoglycoside 6'-N-acetyltransferase I